MSCRGEAALARLVERVHHLAVDVELQLRRGGVADAHRLRALVAGEPGELQFRQAALAGDAVHDLHLRRAAGDRAHQPVAPGARLVVVAGVHQREQRERGVAQPAVAVVPVAHAADLLGQRGGRRGDDAAGRRVGQRLQRDERAAHRAAPIRRSTLQRAAQSFQKPRSRASASCGSTCARRLEVRRRVREHEGERLARADLEARAGAPLAVLERHRRAAAAPCPARRPRAAAAVGAAASPRAPRRRSRSAARPRSPSPRARAGRRRCAPGRIGRSRTGMKSISVTAPSAVSNSVSRTSVSAR